MTDVAHPSSNDAEPEGRDALLARYEAERDKRLRSDGNEQYLEISDRFAHYLDDPYIEVAEREPCTDEVTVAIIGGGFAGLVTGAKLVEAGVTDIRIIEKGGDVGGTWYWNRYPGAQCDTAAMIYMPLLEETGHVPSEKYTHAPEILEHSRRIAETFGLYERALLSTTVTGIEWQPDESRWLITTNRGDAIRARFVAMGPGPLHVPKLPGIAGIETFEGHSFHTSRWDYDYTGGDASGATMDRLADKRVGIIGTGATAVQCVPHLAESAGELFVFQRTPSSIDIRNNHPIDPDWFAQLEPGWQDTWLHNFTTLQTGGFADEDLVKDGWTDLSQRIRDQAIANGDFSPEGLIAAYHDSDDVKMAEIRARVDEVIDDPATASALKPWYRQLCKRPCFHDQFLLAFNRPNAHLVDTDGKGVESIDATGVVVGGEHYELDCLVFASGFEVGTPFTRRAGFDPVGRDGQRLSELWGDGMVSLHGTHVHGFPNLLILGFSQGANLISNVPHNFTEGGKAIAALLRHAVDTDVTEIEPTADAQEAWIARLESGGRMFGNDPSCTPGYYNNEGQLRTREALLGALGYPEGPVAYFEYLEKWRSTGDFEGLDLRRS
ncbi:MAG: NAD(P)/FAD-dependent oxidoreductase [Actinomycetota bacterium]